MNEQLEKLENSVARLVQAYNDLKTQNDALKQELETAKASLSDKTTEVELLQMESTDVRTRIDALLTSLQPAQSAE